MDYKITDWPINVETSLVLALDCQYDQEELEELKDELTQGILAWDRSKKREEHIVQIRDVVMRETVRDDHGDIEGYIVTKSPKTRNAEGPTMKNESPEEQREINTNGLCKKMKPVVKVRVEIDKAVPKDVADEIMAGMNEECEAFNNSILSMTTVERIESD
jgi:hypothetical protein